MLMFHFRVCLLQTLSHFCCPSVKIKQSPWGIRKNKTSQGICNISSNIHASNLQSLFPSCQFSSFFLAKEKFIKFSILLLFLFFLFYFYLNTLSVLLQLGIFNYIFKIFRFISPFKSNTLKVLLIQALGKYGFTEKNTLCL